MLVDLTMYFSSRYFCLCLSVSALSSSRPASCRPTRSNALAIQVSFQCVVKDFPLLLAVSLSVFAAVVCASYKGRVASRADVLRGARPHASCLEEDLGSHRLTKPDIARPLSVPVAPPGGGKTRHMYEEAAYEYAYYFTVCARGNGGSGDLAACSLHALATPTNVQFLLSCLLLARVFICAQLRAIGLTPLQVLLAQVRSTFFL